MWLWVLGFASPCLALPAQTLHNNTLWRAISKQKVIQVRRGNKKLVKQKSTNADTGIQSRDDVSNVQSEIVEATVEITGKNDEKK